MTSSFLRRTIAGLGATALTASTLAIGLGTAHAAPQAEPPSWESNGFEFTRSADTATPGVGDTVRITTRVKNARGTGARVYTLKDVHPSCFRFVEGSARVDGQIENPDNVSFRDIDPDYPDVGYAQVHQGWPGWVGEHTYSFDYKIDDCPADQDLTTTVHFSGYHETFPTWSGDEPFANRGPTIQVQAASSQTQVTAPATASVGKQTTVKAHVSGGSAAKHRGDVQFFANGAPIGTGATDANGDAHVTWTPTAAGDAALTAKYQGNINTSPSSSQALIATVSENVEDTTTTLTVPATAQVGKAVSLSAAVSPAGAGGTVTFRADDAVIASAPVAADGRAQVDWVPESAGNPTIVAEFSGRTGFAGSQSTGTQVQVEEAAAEAVASTTTVDPVAGGVIGAPMTLKARVNAGGAAVGGTVTFKDGDEVIGTGTVQSGGLATVDWTPKYSGTRTLTAVYSGSDTVLSSKASISVSVVGVEPGDGNGQEGNGGGSGSLGSLSGIFGSLGFLGSAGS